MREHEAASSPVSPSVSRARAVRLSIAPSALTHIVSALVTFPLGGSHTQMQLYAAVRRTPGLRCQENTMFLSVSHPDAAFIPGAHRTVECTHI